MQNIKSYQQHLLFDNFPNKVLLKIVLKPMPTLINISLKKYMSSHYFINHVCNTTNTLVNKRTYTIYF